MAERIVRWAKFNGLFGRGSRLGVYKPVMFQLLFLRTISDSGFLETLLSIQSLRSKALRNTIALSTFLTLYEGHGYARQKNYKEVNYFHGSEYIAARPNPASNKLRLFIDGTQTEQINILWVRWQNAKSDNAPRQ